VSRPVMGLLYLDGSKVTRFEVHKLINSVWNN
jgi:hypothetical protein